MPKGSEITPAPLTGGQQYVGRDNVTGAPLLVTSDQVTQGAPWAGAGASDYVLLQEGWRFTSATYDADGIPVSGAVVWPDGTTGTFTATTVNATFFAVDAYEVTHAASSKKVVQAAVTRDSEGRITTQPTPIVASV